MRLDLYLVTDAALCGDRGVAETVRQAVQGGVTTVQLRDKHRTAAEQLRELELLAEAIDGRADLVINDRLDVAVAARERGLPVAGVHLGQGDDAVTRARAELGPRRDRRPHREHPRAPRGCRPDGTWHRRLPRRRRDPPN